MNVDKTVVASIALHVLVIGWGLVSFTSRSLEAEPPESLPVDIVSIDQFAKMTQGIRNGEKDKPKPKVEKVADAKAADDAVGKITEKAPIVTDTAPPPTPKPEEKPVEKKPDPPKPVVEHKPKQELKPAEKKPDPAKEDPIAEALKRQEAKKPKPEAKQAQAQPQPQRQKAERIFDEAKIAALIDKRDPTRQALTGSTLNASAALGTAVGSADSNVATWQGAFRSAVQRCFTPPYNGQDAAQYEADIDIPMKVDGTVAADPVIVAVRGPSRSIASAVAESAKRAIVQCQAYSFLPKKQYDSWKTIPMTFGLKDML